MKVNFTSVISLAMKSHYGRFKPNLIAVAMLFVLLSFSGISFSASSFKWHPGHYYQLVASAKTHPTYMMNSVYKELANTPALLGIQVRYQWGDIETSKGQYNFASIDKHLNEVAKRNKRLVIMIQTKSFGKSETYIPSYLRSPEYDGGVFSYAHYGQSTFKGENLKLWHPSVRQRLAELFRVLGERYNVQPYFEGIGMSESAMGDPLQPVTSTQTDGFYEGLRLTLEAARKAFPNTMVMQSLNYPRPILAPTIETLKKIGGGLSHPDTYLQEPGLIKETPPPGVYTYYPKLAGIIPLSPTVMHHNYRNTRLDNAGHEPTVSELNSFLRDKLKANYIFWTRDYQYYPRVLEFLNSTQVKGKPAGGLSIACPTTYSSCNSN